MEKKISDKLMQIITHITKEGRMGLLDPLTNNGIPEAERLLTAYFKDELSFHDFIEQIVISDYDLISLFEYTYLFAAGMNLQYSLDNGLPVQPLDKVTNYRERVCLFLIKELMERYEDFITDHNLAGQENYIYSVYCHLREKRDLLEQRREYDDFENLRLYIYQKQLLLKDYIHNYFNNRKPCLKLLGLMKDESRRDLLNNALNDVSLINKLISDCIVKMTDQEIAEAYDTVKKDSDGENRP